MSKAAAMLEDPEAAAEADYAREHPELAAKSPAVPILASRQRSNSNDRHQSPRNGIVGEASPLHHPGVLDI
jgi:hypothetical protein